MITIDIEELSPSGKTFSFSSSRFLSTSSKKSHEIRTSIKKNNKNKDRRYWVIKKVNNPSLSYAEILELCECNKEQAIDIMKDQFELKRSLNIMTELSIELSWEELINIAERLWIDRGIIELFYRTSPNLNKIKEYVGDLITAQEINYLNNINDFFKQKNSGSDSDSDSDTTSETNSNINFLNITLLRHNLNFICNLTSKKATKGSKIALAEIEVFAQEFKRLICPQHLFNGHQLFPKYRVAFFDDNSSDIYVASQKINFIDDFIKNSNGILTLGTSCKLLLNGMEYDYSNAQIKAFSIPGLATVTLLAKIVGDIDTKLGNVGLQIFEPLSPSQKPEMYFTSIDSGASFAGYGNIEYTEITDQFGLLNQEEILNNPACELSPFNFLWSKFEGYKDLKEHMIAKTASVQEHIRRENMICCLRVACIPPDALEEITNLYFSSIDKDSMKSKEKTLSHLKNQQEIIFDFLTSHLSARSFFCSKEAIAENLLINELIEMKRNLHHFKFFKKTTLSSIIENIDSLLNERCIQLVSKIIANLSFESKKIFLKKLNSELKHPNKDSLLFEIWNFYEEHEQKMIDSILQENENCMSSLFFSFHHFTSSMNSLFSFCRLR